MKINVEKFKREVAKVWMNNKITHIKKVFDEWVIPMSYNTYAVIVRSWEIKSYRVLEKLYRAWIEMENIVD